MTSHDQQGWEPHPAAAKKGNKARGGQHEPALRPHQGNPSSGAEKHGSRSQDAQQPERAGPRLGREVRLRVAAEKPPGPASSNHPWTACPHLPCAQKCQVQTKHRRFPVTGHLSTDHTSLRPRSWSRPLETLQDSIATKKKKGGGGQGGDEEGTGLSGRPLKPVKSVPRTKVGSPRCAPGRLRP